MGYLHHSDHGGLIVGSGCHINADGSRSDVTVHALFEVHTGSISALKKTVCSMIESPIIINRKNKSKVD